MDLTESRLPTIEDPADPFNRPMTGWGYFGFGVVILASIAALAAAFVKLPYYALAPGSVRDTDPLIELADDRRFAPDGNIHFTTVSIRGRVTPWEMFAGWIDPAIDIVHERVVLRGRDPDENRRVNLELMDTSKNQAVRIAFQQLGYDVLVPAGALVTRIVEKEAADGILSPNDLVVSVDGIEVLQAQDLIAAISGRGPGDTVRLVVGAPGSDETRDVDITLGAKPENPQAGFLGIGIETRHDVELPFDVDIDSGAVGGPSAGLAFTLGVLDVLTPGAITGGGRVAVTGTIADDMTVGPIGGLPQKAAAVRRAGIDTFLVPAGQSEAELALARDLAGDEVTLVPVADLNQALAALDNLGGNGSTLELPA